jgi:endonuclease/exonuclease/phosphatase family metal-dependent hydrolase
MKTTSLFFIIGICLCLLSCTQAKRELTVASYNLRFRNPSDSLQGDGWEQRCFIINNLIVFHDFDIFGTQEGEINQLNDMQSGLPDYRYIGVGRTDGKEGGEFSAIFYKTKKIKLLDSGNFWLAEDTGKPNIGWDAKYARICTWGEFKEIHTGFRFYFFNLHADHKGVEARKNTSKLLLEQIKIIAKGKPVILTGDFNETQYSECYRILNESGQLKDACESAKVRYANNGTFNGFIFKPEDNPSVDSTFLTVDGRIDHIFLTSPFTVERYGILSDTYRQLKNGASSAHEYETRIPSDHYPVVTKLVY